MVILRQKIYNQITLELCFLLAYKFRLPNALISTDQTGAFLTTAVNMNSPPQNYSSISTDF